jgi:hypothetical protein
MPLMSCLLPLIALLERQKRVESVINMRKVQNAHSNEGGVIRLGIHIRLVMKQLILSRWHNFQLHLVLYTR